MLNCILTTIAISIIGLTLAACMYMLVDMALAY